MAAINGAVPVTDTKLLATAAQLRSQWAARTEVASRYIILLRVQTRHRSHARALDELVEPPLCAGPSPCKISQGTAQVDHAASRSHA